MRPCTRSLLLKLEHVAESPVGLLQTDCWAPSAVSDSVHLGKDPRTGLSNKLPGDADTAGSGPHFENHFMVISSSP